MTPQIFGYQHIVYLIVVITIMFSLLMLIRKIKGNEKKVALVVKIIGGVLLCCILWNRISICISRNGSDGFLPGSFCGASSLALALLALFVKKDNAALHCVAYTGLLGGLLTLVYPDFIGQSKSIFYQMTISGLVHHTVMVFLVIVMLYTGFIVPDIRKWHYLPMGLCVYMTYGVFCIKILGYSNAMYINEPILPDTDLNWFVIGIIFLVLHAIFLFIWKLLKKHFC